MLGVKYSYMKRFGFDMGNIIFTYHIQSPLIQKFDLSMVAMYQRWLERMFICIHQVYLCPKKIQRAENSNMQPSTHFLNWQDILKNFHTMGWHAAGCLIQGRDCTPHPTVIFRNVPLWGKDMSLPHYQPL